MPTVFARIVGSDQNLRTEPRWRWLRTGAEKSEQTEPEYSRLSRARVEKSRIRIGKEEFNMEDYV